MNEEMNELRFSFICGSEESLFDLLEPGDYLTMNILFGQVLAGLQVEFPWE